MNQIEAIAALFLNKGYVAVSNKYVMDIGNNVEPGNKMFDTVMMGEVHVDKSGKVKVVNKRIPFRIDKDTLSREYKILDEKLHVRGEEELLGEEGDLAFHMTYVLGEMARNNNFAFEDDRYALYVDSNGTFKGVALYDNMEEVLEISRFQLNIGWKLYPRLYKYAEAKSRKGKICVEGDCTDYLGQLGYGYGDGYEFDSMDEFKAVMQKVVSKWGKDVLNGAFDTSWVTFEEDWKTVRRKRVNGLHS